MFAMILAAGRGERLKPLTDEIPKPLLEVNGTALIVYQIQALAKAGCKELVINLGHLGHKIRSRLGSGEHFDVKIHYSDEGSLPLETAGGIIKAMPLLGEDPFIVTNADIYTDFDYRLLPKSFNADAHLVLVDNPPHNIEGDFALDNGRVLNQGKTMLTYSGIGLFRPKFFSDCPMGRYPLAPLLRQSADKGCLSGQHFSGNWCDIGTPERLQEIQDI